MIRSQILKMGGGRHDSRHQVFMIMIRFRKIIFYLCDEENTFF